MGSGGIRIALAVIFLTAFLVSYSWILWDFMHFQTADCNEMQKYLLRTNGLKVVVFSAYGVTNCLMTRSCETRFENELLLTGIFSIIFISVFTVLHYTHLLIMPTQWNLILFNGTTIAFFALVYIGGRRHGNFTDE